MYALDNDPICDRNSEPCLRFRAPPAAYPRRWQWAPSSVGLHNCRLHLTLSRQWFTHRFTCTFWWCSPALILITSTAPFPSVQTSSSFDCRNIIPLLSPLWLLLDLPSLLVLSPCMISFTSQPLRQYGYRSSHLDSGQLTCTSNQSAWHPHLDISQASQKEHIWSGITDTHPSVTLLQVCFSPVL